MDSCSLTGNLREKPLKGASQSIGKGIFENETLGTEPSAKSDE